MATDRRTPAELVDEARSRWGEAEVARRAARLVTGAADAPLVLLLGEPISANDRWLAKAVNAYWPRVWGARALRYAWHDDAIPSVVTGLCDEHWRVREMCAKVTALREVSEAADRVAVLTSEQTPRVRVAALRALAVVGEAEHAQAVLEALADSEPAVRRAAAHALEQLEQRLDRTLT